MTKTKQKFLTLLMWFGLPACAVAWQGFPNTMWFGQNDFVFVCLVLPYTFKMFFIVKTIHCEKCFFIVSVYYKIMLIYINMDLFH